METITAETAPETTSEDAVSEPAEPTVDDLDITIDLREFGRLGVSHRRLSRPSPWRWTVGGLMLGAGCFVVGTLTMLDEIIDGAPGADIAMGAWAWASTYIAVCGVILTIADTILDGR